MSHINCNQNNFLKNTNMLEEWVINYFASDFISQVKMKMKMAVIASFEDIVTNYQKQ